MTAVDPETRIPDPIDVDAAEEARLRAVAGLGPPAAAPGSEYAGFELVGVPDRPPQTERERDMYTLEEGEMLLNMGPQHPSTHGVLRLVVKIRGEVVTDLDPVFGYLHRGIEKLCENATYTTVLTYVDPMDYLASMHNEHAPASAFEKLFGIKAPPRAEYIRALVVELLASISGQRMLFNFFRVGGVNWDVNDEFLSRLGKWHGTVLKSIGDNEKLITENEIFKGRTQGMGILTGDQAISYGVTGPNLRASGVPFDVRKAHPYSIYNELEFDVITQQRGDVYARYLQRIAEIKQSLHLIDQIMDKMPHGPVQAQVPGIIRPKPGRAYGAVESPRGLYSVYAISDGGPTPYRFRMRDPSFITLQVMPMLMPGHLIADTMAIMASLDPVMGGVDK